SAFAMLVAQRADALLVGGNPFLEGRNQQLVALTTRHAIPAIFNFRESVLRGGLMSYGVNISNNYRQLGAYAGRILKGESAAEFAHHVSGHLRLCRQSGDSEGTSRPLQPIRKDLVIRFRRQRLAREAIMAAKEISVKKYVVRLSGEERE